MTVIITNRGDDGQSRGSVGELADEVRAVDADADIRIVKGAITGVAVDDATAVRWLMQRYTATGKLRKGADNG